MKLTSAATYLVVAVLAGMMTVGCCKKEKQHIAALTAENQELLNQKNDLQRQLARARAVESELMTQLDARNAEMAAMAARLKSAQAQPAQPAMKDWERGLVSDKVTVGTDILFASGKATLTSAGKNRLDQIITTLKRQYPGKLVRVHGYTDTDPIKKTKDLWQDNLDLSANRAMAVTRYLRDHGIDAENIETVAMGETHAKASNSTKAGKAQNRRVELVVLK